MSNIDAATVLQDAVRKEIQPGFIKISISRLLNDEQDMNAKHVKEIELLSSSLTITNDENELDLTNFVPSINRKIPTSKIKQIVLLFEVMFIFIILEPEIHSSPIKTQVMLNEKRKSKTSVNYKNKEICFLENQEEFINQKYV